MLQAKQSKLENSETDKINNSLNKNQKGEHDLPAHILLQEENDENEALNLDLENLNLKNDNNNNNMNMNMNLNTFSNKHPIQNQHIESMAGDIIIDNSFGEENKGLGVKENMKREPKIISLDKLTKYNNIFIIVHPFIFHGYRIHHTVRDCFFSIFKLHNETFNIWSHLIPFFGFLAIMIYDLISKEYYE